MHNFLISGYSFPMTIFSLLLILPGCKSTQLSVREGQEANLLFPYPCDSTQVTLQQSQRSPFYESTDGSTLQLPSAQVNRFKVQIRMESGNCFLNLTIRNLMRIDEGTYISLVYKGGETLNDDTHLIRLKVNYPPDMASCTVEKDKGGDWVSINCTANSGSLPGKIECYQNGEWMPPLTDPTETDTLLKQTILIRKSQPAFCCSSARNEDKLRCECNDTGLNLADDSSHPCPSSEITMPPPTFTKVSQSDHYPTLTHSNPFKETDRNDKKTVILLSVFLPLITVMLFVLILFVTYKIILKNKNDGNSKVSAKADEGTRPGHVLLNGLLIQNGKENEEIQPKDTWNAV